jgi:hypothetical protein
MGESYYHRSTKLPQRCEKKIWTLILNCTGSLSGALNHRLTFLPNFTDQPVFKISSTDPVLFNHSLKVWSGLSADSVFQNSGTYILRISRLTCI